MIRTIATLIASALIVLSLAGFAFAGASTGDIAIDSQAGRVVNYAAGNNVTAETNVHSVSIRDGATTGDITIIGRVDEVVNVAMGGNVRAVTNVGSVRVGQ